MKLLALIENAMLSLSTLPGLQFLSGYVMEMRGRKMRREQHISKYSSYVQTVRGVATDVTGAIGGGPKKRSASKPQKELRNEETEIIDDEDDDDDDLETFRF